jgi:hypothetical protein
MRRIQDSVLALVLCAVLAACGASSKSTSGNGGGGNGGGGGNPPPPPPPPPPNVTMQAGQWEFVVNNGLYYVEANVTDSGGAISSIVYNTQVFNPAQEVASAPPGVDCGNVEMSGAISAYSLTGSLESGNNPIMNFTGSVDSTGQSVLGGTSSAPNEVCGVFNSEVSGGTFTGYTVPPFNGTYTGQITSWPSGTSPLTLTLTLTQSPNFVIGGSGQWGTETLVFPNSPAGNNVYSGVIGATFTLEGTFANGSYAAQIQGHANSDGTQVAVNFLYSSPPLSLTGGTWLTGTLTKQ